MKSEGVPEQGELPVSLPSTQMLCNSMTEQGMGTLSSDRQGPRSTSRSTIFDLSTKEQDCAEAPISALDPILNVEEPGIVVAW